MDFVINNYIIFIIIGVVLLMALIGYIADNTNFEKKPKKEKKSKKAKETKKEDVITELETPTVDSNISNETTQLPTDMNNQSETSSTEAGAIDGLMGAFDVPANLNAEPATTPVVETQDGTLETEAAVDPNEETSATEQPVNETSENAEQTVASTEEEVVEPVENVDVAQQNNNTEQNNQENSDDIWKF